MVQEEREKASGPSRSLHPSSTFSVWKTMIDSGVFDDFFPQRVSAAFNFLCDSSETSSGYASFSGATFTLQNLIQKGKEIFTFLSLNIDKDSNFAIMDLFRVFDKSGRGFVTQEDFAIGILTKIEELYYNKSLLEAMALELLGIEPRCIELATLLEKNNKLKTSKFERNLKSFSFLIKNQIRFVKKEKNLTILDTVELIKIFETVLLQIISDIKNYFHISLHKLLFLNLFSSDDTNILVNNKSELLFLTSFTNEEENDDANKENSNLISSVKQLHCVWNLTSSTTYENSLASDSTNLGTVTSPAWGVNDQNPQTANYNLVNDASIMKHTHSSHMGLKGMGGSINSSQLDWNNLLYDLTSNFFNIDWSQLMNPENSLSHSKFDKSQLYLLQDIFLAINNFILYRSSIDSNKNSLTQTDLLESIEINTTQNNEETKEKKTKILSNIDVKSRIAEYKKLIQDNLIELSSSSSLDTLTIGTNELDTSPIPVNSKKEKGILSIIPNEGENSMNTTTQDNPEDFINKSTLYETILSEELFYTQELLIKTQTRLKILELIQSEIVIEENNNNNNDEGTSEVDSIDNNSISNSSSYEKKDKNTNLKQFNFKKDRNSIKKKESSDHFTEIDKMSIDESQDEKKEILNSSILDFDESDDENKSFDDIIKELQHLGATLSERALETSSLGLFLKKDVLLLDNTEDISIRASKKINNLLLNMKHNIDSIENDLNTKISINEEKISNNNKLQKLEELLSEYKIKVEQAELDRNQILALNIELQVLREKNTKLYRDEKKEKDLERVNDELLIKNKNLENELNKMIQNLNNYSILSSISIPSSSSSFNPFSPASFSMVSPSSASAPPTASKIVAYNDGVFMSVEEYKKLSESITNLTKKNDEISNELEQINKENQRIKTGMKVSDQRVKGSLQDQMTLHQQIQTLEEDLLIAKTSITKLHRDVEESNQLRAYKEDADRKIFEMAKEIGKKDVELTDARDSTALVNKYHQELLNYERVIETLEQKVSEYSVELEKGSVAQNQLENYREQLRIKTQENRDLSLHIHSIETQLKDMPYLLSRMNELSNELKESKIKCEKIPSLLAEISRLRGSNRASIKALNEQDKVVNQLKSRLKVVEKENAVMNNERYGVKELENKLNDANQEINRLMTIVAEVNTLKAGVKSAEEEKKALEGQYKKMRKYLRQSVVMSSSINIMKEVHKEQENDQINSNDF